MTIDKKAEAITPIWVCNLQNNLVDAAWFEKKEVFNRTSGREWTATEEKIKFPSGKNWRDYVRAKRLEIACGEAPYLASREDFYAKKIIALGQRVGILDRKLRVVSENVDDREEWLEWGLFALEAVYGFEIRTEKVEKARKNLELTFFDYYLAKFGGDSSVNTEEILAKRQAIAQKEKAIAFRNERFSKKIQAIAEKVEEILQKNIIVADIFQEDAAILADLKFEAIVGNPPYHKTGGAGGSNDAPIYQDFAKWCFENGAQYVSLVIPARWFAGGRENLLGKFRKYMLAEAGIRDLLVYSEARAVFDWVNLSGGICIFLAERGFRGECEYVLQEKGEVMRAKRDLGKSEILIREVQLVTIVEKVQKKMEIEGRKTVREIVLGNTPFGITSELKDYKGRDIELYIERGAKHNVKLYFFDKPCRVVRYISRKHIGKNKDMLKNPKVMLPAAGGTGSDRYIIGKTEMIGRNSVCSQSYLVAVFESDEEMEGFWKYTQTKFFRVLVKACKVSQSASRRVYRFVPLEDFGAKSEIDWGGEVAEVDRQLYEKYGLSAEERDFIEKRIEYFR